MQPKISTLIFVFFLGVPAWGSNVCHVPSTAELKTFFDNHANWTQVEDSKSNVMAARNVIQIRIHFSEPLKSRVYRAGKIMGKIEQVCLTEDGEGILISAKGHNIRMRQSREGLISELRFLGLHTFHYLPDAYVQKRTSEVYDSEQQAEDGHTVVI